MALRVVEGTKAELLNFIRGRGVVVGDLSREWIEEWIKVHDDNLNVPTTENARQPLSGVVVMHDADGEVDHYPAAAGFQSDQAGGLSITEQDGVFCTYAAGYWQAVCSADKLPARQIF